MKFLLSILLLISCAARAGNHYTYNVSGNFTVTQTNSGHTLANNDTVSIIGTSLGSLTISGISGTNIYLDFSQAFFANHNKCFGCLDQMFWENLSGVIIADLNMPEHYMTIRWHFVSKTKLLRFKNVNTGTNVSDAPVIQADWPYDTGMVFTGSLSQTFNRDTLQDCKFDGFLDCSDPVVFGSNWSTGATPTEIKRSIAIRPVFIRDTIQNCSSSTGSIGVGGITGTGPGAIFKDCVFRNMDGPGSANHSHNEAILWYGTVTIDGGYMDRSYASFARIYPLGWSDGIAGYNEDADHVVIKNVIDTGKLSYSFGEITKTGAGNRIGNGFVWRRSVIIHNTVYSTTGLSYNGPSRYNGKVCDFTNADSVTLIGNLIINPEHDYAVVPYGPDSTSHNGYFYQEIGAAATNKVVNYNFSSRYGIAYLQDTTLTFMPKATGPLRGIVPANADYTADRNGVAVSPTTGTSDIGAVQYVSAGSPPSCTTNLLPTSGSTVAGTTSATFTWNPSAGATSYQFWLDGALVTAVGGTTYNGFSYAPGSTHTWYIVPTNTFGAATGCSSSPFTFTTASAPVAPGIFLIYRK